MAFNILVFNLIFPLFSQIHFINIGHILIFRRLFKNIRDANHEDKYIAQYVFYPAIYERRISESLSIININPRHFSFQRNHSPDPRIFGKDDDDNLPQKEILTKIFLYI